MKKFLVLILLLISSLYGYGQLQIGNGGTLSIGSPGSGGSGCGTSPCPVNQGGTGATSFTPYSLLFGGTTSTSSFQSLTSLGNAGQALISGGASILPSFGTLGIAGGGTGANSQSSAFTNIVSPGGTITGSFSLTTPLGIASGGTNANTTSQALTNLGAFPVSGGTITGSLTTQGPVTVPALTATTLQTNQLATPAAPTGTISTTGGTLAAGTYTVEIAAIDGLGNSTSVGTSTGFTTTGSTSSIALSWTAVPNATSYNVWLTSGQYFNTSTPSFSLTTSTGTTGTPPTVNNTGGAKVAGPLDVTSGSPGVTTPLIQLTGSTSGQAVITAPAIAGTPSISTGVTSGTMAIITPVQQAGYTYAADSGTANAYAVSLSPAPTIVAGSIVRFKALNANTGASTLAVNGGTAVALDTQALAALPSGAILAGGLYEAQFDGTEYQLLNSSSSGGSVTGAIIQNPATTATNTISPTATTVVPLTLNTPSSGTADALDVDNNGAKNFWVDAYGDTHVGSYLMSTFIQSSQSLVIEAFPSATTYDVQTSAGFAGSAVIGDVVTFGTATHSVVDCPLSCTNSVGVVLATPSSNDQVQTTGSVTVNFDGTYSPAAGWYACTSAITAGKVTPQSAPCPPLRQVGFITTAATSAASGTVYISFGGSPLTGTTATITGTALSSTCDSGTATVPGAIVGRPVAVSSTTGADVGGAFNLRASVTAAGTVTVYVCGTGTPASLAYNVSVQ